MNKMYKKLLKVQEKIGAIKKDTTNPFYKSKYFDINSLLEHVKPVLNENGLILLQGLSHIDGKLALTTVIREADGDGEISFTCPLPETPDAQKAGSAVTYFRRYALQSLLALEAEDDDANSVSGENRVKVPYKPVAVKKAEFEQNKASKDNDESPF